MRLSSILICGALLLSGCAVSQKTARHSGTGMSTLGIDTGADPASTTTADGSVDYRAKLFNDLASQ